MASRALLPRRERASWRGRSRSGARRGARRAAAGGCGGGVAPRAARGGGGSGGDGEAVRPARAAAAREGWAGGAGRADDGGGAGDDDDHGERGRRGGHGAVHGAGAGDVVAGDAVLRQQVAVDAEPGQCRQLQARQVPSTLGETDIEEVARLIVNRLPRIQQAAGRHHHAPGRAQHVLVQQYRPLRQLRTGPRIQRLPLLRILAPRISILVLPHATRLRL